jgi:hypothetical protein
MATGLPQKNPVFIRDSDLAVNRIWVPGLSSTTALVDSSGNITSAGVTATTGVFSSTVTAAGITSTSATSLTGLILSVQASITAFHTGGQGSATPLTGDVCIVTTCASNADSVLLPQSATGKAVVVINNTGQSLAVFPTGTGTINAGSASASVTITTDVAKWFIGLDTANDWFTA